MAEHCGYICRIKELRKHSNADRLQVATIFDQNVIVGIDTKIGDMGVFFPSDLQLSEEFCKENDLVRRKDENGNDAGGYLDPVKRNIKAIKLRGEKSEGIFLPITSLAAFCKTSDLHEGDQIDILNGVEICRKYIPRTNISAKGSGEHLKKAKVNFAPTFYEHVDTAQIVYHLDDFHSGDVIELTLKMHGTSGRTGYVQLVHNKQSWFDKLFHREGKQYKEYGYVTGTRRVVLDENHDGGYYADNSFRREIEKKFVGKLHKGEICYYEIVGYQGTSGQPIMATVSNKGVSDKNFIKQYGENTVFSYGCSPAGGYEHVFYEDDPSSDIIVPPCCEAYVYRMAMVNEDGDLVEYTPDQMRYRCAQMGVNTVPLFERFIIPDKPVDADGHEISAGEYVLHKIEEYYDGPDPIGLTHIREGVVARIVSKPKIAVYKHKNFYFRVIEGIAKDTAAAPDIEEAQDENADS